MFAKLSRISTRFSFILIHLIFMDYLKEAFTDFEALHDAILASLRCRLSKRTRRNNKNRPPPWRHPQYQEPPKLMPYYQPIMHGLSLTEARKVRQRIAAYEAVCEGMTSPLTPDETHIIIDNGSSITISNTKEDFITQIHPV